MMTAPAYRAHPIKNFFRNEGNRWRRHPASALLRLLCRLSVLITIFALLAIVIDLLVKGIPHLTPELFSLKYTTENQSMLPAIINTLLIALVALLVAIPIGVGGAIYLAEYAKRNSPLVRTIRLTAETLQGIPSIIYGLFGMVFFTALRINLTLLSGALTLSLMVLPLILRTTEEALLSIPDSYREGSFGLGAGKLRTVIKIVLPPAMPGILSGVVLAIGRIVGETAALLFTAGTVADMPRHFLLSSGRTLAVHMYQLSLEGAALRPSIRHGRGAAAARAGAEQPVQPDFPQNRRKSIMIIDMQEAIKNKTAHPDDTPADVKIAIKDLNLYYGAFHALHGINLDIERGKITAFIGPSGCGKSTLLKTLNRMNDLIPDCRVEGSITLDGEDIYGSMDVNLLRKRVGMVFQKPNPFPMSVYDNIAYGPRTHGIHRKAQLDEIVESSLRNAAIWDELKDRLNKSALGLSGGQQQRLCIARALAVEPEVLLMDEPTSALDPISTSKIEELCMELKGKYTIVIVTHNMQQALRIADTTAFFLLGDMVEVGATDQLFSMPRDKRTEDYITGRFG